MKNALILKSILATGTLIITIIVFSLLQNQTVYDATLSKISSNYEHTGKEKNFQIIETKKPYEKITHSNMYMWDAKLYKSISNSAYASADSYF